MLWNTIERWIKAFIDGYREQRYDAVQQDRLVYSSLTEKQIDHTVEDSFPASDPPANY